MENPTKIDNSKAKLGYRERDRLYQKEYTTLKIKVALNYFELFALFTVLTIGFYLLLTLTGWTDRVLLVSMAITSGLILTGIFYKIKKYQIKITRFDKEDIYKKISKDLLADKG